MLGFFPTPHPGEILYSVLARYHVRSGNTGPKATLKELFGSTTTIATVDLPSNLNALVQRLPPFCTYNSESLINNYTLFPLYEPVLIPDRAKMVRDSMRGDFGGDIHTRSGIMASAIHTPAFLRFCPTCFQEDERQYGEAYWHRVHQAPGVWVCNRHQVLLQNSLIPMQGYNRHAFTAAENENCVASLGSPCLSAKTFERLAQMAGDVEWLVEACLPSRSGEWYRQQYQSLLIEKGLATAGGRVYQNEFQKEFAQFFGSEYLNCFNSWVTPGKAIWLSGVAQKQRKSLHPLRHLLLIRFFGLTPQSFFEENYQYKPFGAGPWVCFNGASDHYLQAVVTDIQTKWSTDLKKAVGTFSCSCGFVYSRGITSPTQAASGSGKIKSFGPIWEQKLRDYLERDNLGLRETARQLKVDPNTIKRYIVILDLSPVWAQKGYKQGGKGHLFESDGVKHETRRQQWLDLQERFPGQSQTQLRRSSPALFAWLYRNDRAWLGENAPLGRWATTSKARIDWNERDRSLLNQVGKTVHIILKAKRPTRITITKIGRLIGAKSILERHLSKLPLTKSYLAGIIESLEQFQIRRIRHVIQRLQASGQRLRVWEVVRLAGLRPEQAKKFAELIETEICKATQLGFVPLISTPHE